MAELDMIMDAFKNGLSLTRSGWRELFTELMKVNALSMLVVALSVAAGAWIMAFGMGGSSGAWMAVAGAVLVILVFMLVAAAASSVSYNIVDGVAGKARQGITKGFLQNLVPVFAYSIILWLAMGAFAILPSVLLEMAGEGLGSGISQLLARLASQAYYYAAIFIIGFVFQFSLFELVVKRSGVLPSFGNSVRIIRRTFIPTAIFYIIGGLFSTLVQLILLIPAAIIFIVPAALGVAVAYAASNAILNLALLAIGLLYFLLVLVAYTSAKLAITLPINYFYWRTAREKE